MTTPSANDFIFTSYCFSNAAAQGDYLPQQERLKESILRLYPNANLHFFNETEEVGKPKFQASMYGYKVQLVAECITKGFTKIIYLDTAICLEDKVDDWFTLAKEHGVLAIKDNNTLFNVTSDKCLKHLGMTREQLNSIQLLGGSIYVFDFENHKAQDIFTNWHYMETQGLFGTQDECSNGNQGHRMDETCMALAMEMSGVKPLGYDLMRYAYIKPDGTRVGDSNPIAIKRHFK